ncbi:MAG: hypothetical protein AMXMBFR13_31130 [Phycisphaerae bacterium]
MLRDVVFAAGGLASLGVLLVGVLPANAQHTVFVDEFDAYAAGGAPPEFLAVWPLDSDCDAARISAGTGVDGNSAYQGKDGNDDTVGARHRHYLTATEIQSVPGAPANADALRADAADPIIVAFQLDLGTQAYQQQIRYVELTCGNDRAPTPMIFPDPGSLECNGKVRRYLNPQGDGEVHGSIAVGAIAIVDTTPCGGTATGDERQETYRLSIYDGQEWHELYNWPVVGTNIHLHTRWNQVTLTIWPTTFDVELENGYVSGVQGVYGVPRKYLGDFNSVVMGGVPDEEYGGCFRQNSPGRNANHVFTNHLDELYIRGGLAVLADPPCVIVEPPGACCVSTGYGVGNCSSLSEEECTNAGGTFLGSGTSCDANQSSCDFCPALFADTDDDGDVDQSDFGLWQACFTGPFGGQVAGGCGCFDRDNAGAGDGDVDEDDFIQFTNCALGPQIPVSASSPPAGCTP